MLKKSRIAMLVAGALFAAQAGVVLGNSDDSIWLDESSSSSGPQQLTVFNPDGSSYSITPVDVQVATFGPALLVAAGEPLPQQLTVFEPSGLSSTYEFTPIEVTMVESIEFVMDETTIGPLVLSDEEAASGPTYVAHFVSAPTYTGILEKAIS